MKLLIVLGLILSTLLSMSTEIVPASRGEGDQLIYNFSYSFCMEMKGKYMLIVPYRFYHEVSASVNFQMREDKTGNYEFCYAGIGDTGYVISTGGLKGSSLWCFSADYDLDKATGFRNHIIENFQKTYPYYTNRIKKIRHRPMKILSTADDSIRFSRTAEGVHYNPIVNMQLSDPHSFTYSNIYKILGKLLIAYNHSYWPDSEKNGTASTPGQWTGRVWFSPLLDFSTVLEDAAKLTSEGAEKNADFKQKKSFRLQYRVTAINNQVIEICGESFPNVNVWKDMNITQTKRKIRIRQEDNVMVSDSMYLVFKDKKGNWGTVDLLLQLI